MNMLKKTHECGIVCGISSFKSTQVLQSVPRRFHIYNQTIFLYFSWKSSRDGFVTKPVVLNYQRKVRINAAAASTLADGMEVFPVLDKSRNQVSLFVCLFSLFYAWRLFLKPALLRSVFGICSSALGYVQGFLFILKIVL